MLQQRLKLTQDIGHDNQVLASLNFLCGIYADAGLFADAVALIANRPDMWRTAWTAHAQISAGQYEEVMDYLPQETASCLRIGSIYNLARYLIAWAMLLLSNRALVAVAESNGSIVPVADEARFAQAVEILALFRSYEQCDPTTRNQAKRLLAKALNETDNPDTAKSPKSLSIRSIDEVARAVMNIRLADRGAVTDSYADF